MKRMYKLSVLVVVVIFSFLSCEDMMDVHKPFVGDKEIVYSPKLDSLSFYAGQNKVYCKFWMYNATNVKSVDIFWDKDSLIIPVSLSSGLDSMLVEVSCSQEKSYTFNVRTTDIFGNHSLWSTGFGNSYGDFFLQSLLNRSIKGFKIANGGGVINWFPSAANLFRSEVRYIDNLDKEQVVTIPKNEMNTFCPGLTSNQFELRSFFIPEPDAIDTFVISWEPMRPLYQYARTNWSVKYCNSWQSMPSLTQSSNMPHFTFDGDFNTFWHSRYLTYKAGDNPLDPTITRDPCPFTIVIDMSAPVNIMQLDIYRRLSNNNTQTVIAYVQAVDDNMLTKEDFEWLGDTPVQYSNHSFFKNYQYPGVANDHWIELGRVEFPTESFSTPEQNMRFIDGTQINSESRYLKLVLPNSRSNGNVQISEIFVWGK